MKAIRSHLSYANVMSTIAVFFAITGASAFAATQLSKNSVGSKQIKKNAVTSVKIKRSAVTADKIKNKTITGADINKAKLGAVPLADSLSGLTRGSLVRVAATSGADFDAATAAAPEQLLASAGPFSVYGKCAAYGTNVRATAYIKSTVGGAVFDGDEDGLDGDPFLEPGTTENNRELMYNTVSSTGDSSFYGVHSSEFVAAATDGTVFRGDISLGTKSGDLPGDQGVFGAGSACVFTVNSIRNGL